MERQKVSTVTTGAEAILAADLLEDLGHHSFLDLRVVRHAIHWRCFGSLPLPPCHAHVQSRR